eukprot:TRINITY_DN8082_c0_g1_i1.p1 TRINITY_DN8082_c0_g1~~TRINITY_DN8082_c0_g1_i1.p1  ORF type:complete len:310 (+),score=37.20 TRINITY_DN8082_c0_g1_i1:110-931(+)
MAHIEGIFIAPYSTAPMRPIPKASVKAGVGIVGDRYSRDIQLGTYSASFCRELGKQLTLISADAIETEMAKTGLEPLPVGDLRRNIVIRGITGDTLNSFVGHEVMIGTSCRVFVHRLTVPCKYNEALNKRPGLMEKLWFVSGVNCEVLSDGEVQVGDVVTRVPGSFQPSRCDLSSKPPHWDVRPSKLTREQHREKTLSPEKAMANAKADPDGARRLEMAYRSVGLRCYPTEVAEVIMARRQWLSAGAWTAIAAASVAAVAIAVTVARSRRSRP